MARAQGSSRSRPLGLGMLALTLLGSACEGKGRGAAKDDAGAERSAATATAPALVGKTLDGASFNLAEHRGEVVLVNVWATWCAPCREELPELRALHERLGPRGFTVVGVSEDRRAAVASVRQMAADFRLPYPIVFDPEGDAIEGWKVHGYPTSFLVDRGGAVTWRRDGIVRPQDDELGAAIEAALAAR
ncbi:MAG: TlpA family protein disulfide reductase [Nannocystaceae bacterium]|nr:TlpA family protein disulfide reductase [Nannocystaceae bacterium]